jgi:DNA-binding response OmpR family regulator
VDDSSDIRELLALHLRNAGYRVVTAEDAIEAGRLVLRQPPDLMVVDVNMPYMDGMEFVATLTADSTVPCFPVIFLTSRDDVQERAQLLGASCLRKPVRADDLVAFVGGAIEDKGSAAVPVLPCGAPQALKAPD